MTNDIEGQLVIHCEDLVDDTTSMASATLEASSVASELQEEPMTIVTDKTLINDSIPIAPVDTNEVTEMSSSLVLRATENRVTLNHASPIDYESMLGQMQVELDAFKTVNKTLAIELAKKEHEVKELRHWNEFMLNRLVGSTIEGTCPASLMDNEAAAHEE